MEVDTVLWEHISLHPHHVLSSPNPSTALCNLHISLLEHLNYPLQSSNTQTHLQAESTNHPINTKHHHQDASSPHSPDGTHLPRLRHRYAHPHHPGRPPAAMQHPGRRRPLRNTLRSNANPVPRASLAQGQVQADFAPLQEAEDPHPQGPDRLCLRPRPRWWRAVRCHVKRQIWVLAALVFRG
jgi:hypothetical protein